MIISLSTAALAKNLKQVEAIVNASGRPHYTDVTVDDLKIVIVVDTEKRCSLMLITKNQNDQARVLLSLNGMTDSLYSLRLESLQDTDEDVVMVPIETVLLNSHNQFIEFVLK